MPHTLPVNLKEQFWTVSFFKMDKQLPDGSHQETKKQEDDEQNVSADNDVNYKENEC